MIDWSAGGLAGWLAGSLGAPGLSVPMSTHLCRSSTGRGVG